MHAWGLELFVGSHLRLRNTYIESGVQYRSWDHKVPPESPNKASIRQISTPNLDEVTHLSTYLSTYVPVPLMYIPTWPSPSCKLSMVFIQTSPPEILRPLLHSTHPQDLLPPTIRTCLHQGVRHPPPSANSYPAVPTGASGTIPSPYPPGLNSPFSTGASVYRE